MNIDISNVEYNDENIKKNDNNNDNNDNAIEIHDDDPQDTSTNSMSISKLEQIRNIRNEDHFQNHIIICEDEPPEVQRIKIVLNMIRKNCVKHSLYHNARYHFYRKCLVGCFRIPSLILSSLNP